MARSQTSPKIVVPKTDEDRPPLARVGVIALVGFAIGVVWPWLAGVRFVPTAPGDDDGSEAAAILASAAPAASAAPPPAPEQAEPTIERTNEQRVEIGEPIIISCHDEQGRKKRDCDAVDFMSVARDKLLALAACPAAKGASKVLSIGFDVDFEKNKIRDIDEGKSTTFDSDKARALLDCAKKEFETVDLSGIAHEQARYSIYYLLEFVPPGTVVKDEGGEGHDKMVQASGLATVRWDVALVRESPDDGEVRARLRYGTRVEVAGRKGKWYLVEYDGKGTKGWVHENAIGL